MKRLIRPILVTFVAVALFYMLGGSDGVRRIQGRWRAFQQPPTVEQMRVPVRPVVPLRAALPPEAVRGRMWLSDPPGRVSIAVVLAAILTAAGIAMYVTGRPDRKRGGVRF
jgi:hypothetical protein